MGVLKCYEMVFCVRKIKSYIIFDFIVVDLFNDIYVLFKFWSDSVRVVWFFRFRVFVIGSLV